eukprot:TRINITY_DN80924_c0_g1_i1.p1 TRINITY_DN80924_c0_g1~~TRINITY_DN80924_c0_g1_i1.p1  ORF type:complete len:720 (-),score=108.86 TRINITY_DN80924_c0_g1_i1:188-2347(-)
MSSLIGGTGVLPWLVQAIKGKRKRNHGYTIEELEEELYDNRLKLLDGIFSVDGDKQPDPGVIRCLNDRRAECIDLTLMLVVNIGLFVTPVVFMWRGSWNKPELVPGGRALLGLDVALDVVYACCLCLQLWMSFLHPTRRVEVVVLREIRSRLLCSPTYITMCASVMAHLLTNLIDFPLLLAIKCIRIYHFMCPPDSFWWLEDASWWRLSRPVVLLLYGSHWGACLFACVGDYYAIRADHETSFGTGTVDGGLSLYSMGFIEALYLLTGAMDNPIGDGSIRDKKFGSLLVIAIFGPVGCIVAAHFISAITTEIRLSNALENRHEENKAFITRALENLNISVGLQRRVFSQYLYQRISHDYEAFSQLFDKKNLSEPLNLALRVYLYHDTVLYSDFLKGKDHAYVLEVVKVLQDQTFVPGDFVARKGEVGTKMYFIGRGELSVWVTVAPGDTNFANSMQVGQMAKGRFFGEVALVQESLRTAWIMAESYCLLSSLSRADIEDIWYYFPKERSEVEERVRATAERDRKRAEDHDCNRKLETKKTAPLALVECSETKNKDGGDLEKKPALLPRVCGDSMQRLEETCQRVADGTSELYLVTEVLLKRQKILQQKLDEVPAPNGQMPADALAQGARGKTRRGGPVGSGAGSKRAAQKKAARGHGDGSTHRNGKGHVPEVVKVDIPTGAIMEVAPVLKASPRSPDDDVAQAPDPDHADADPPAGSNT